MVFVPMRLCASPCLRPCNRVWARASISCEGVRRCADKGGLRGTIGHAPPSLRGTCATLSRREQGTGTQGC
jgi:hypothetical protein